MPADRPIAWILFGFAAVCLLVGLLLEVRDRRRRRADCGLYARGLGLTTLPRRSRRSRRRWARW